jgi:ABC-2 type transport system permease protein
MLKNLLNLLNYQDLIKSLVGRDLKARYKNSVLGYIWTWLDPLLTMLVFVLVFGIILNMRTENFPVYLISGLVPWIFFSQTLTGCVKAITGNAGLIKRVFFPREIFPLTLALSNTINLLFSLIVALALVLIFGLPLTLKIFLLPIHIFFLLLLALGIGFFFSNMGVFFRDLSHIIPFVIRLWFYLTPIFYVVEGRIPEKYLNIYMFLNPLAVFLALFRSSLMGMDWPDVKYVISCFLTSVVVFIAGYIFFKKTEDRMVKWI